MKKFCTKRNMEVEIADVGGNLGCPEGMEVECTQAQCRYCLGARMRMDMFGESPEKFPDYTR